MRGRNRFVVPPPFPVVWYNNQGVKQDVMTEYPSVVLIANL